MRSVSDGLGNDGNAMKISINEFGTPVLERKCSTCGGNFTVCPVPENLHDWQDCLSEDCGSYDPDRDVDKLFDGDRIVRERRTIH